MKAQLKALQNKLEKEQVSRSEWQQQPLHRLNTNRLVIIDEWLERMSIPNEQLPNRNKWRAILTFIILTIIQHTLSLLHNITDREKKASLIDNMLSKIEAVIALYQAKIFKDYAQYPEYINPFNDFNGENPFEYHEVLGVSPDASLEEIESAYEQRMQALGPEKDDNEEKAQERARCRCAREKLRERFHRRQHQNNANYHHRNSAPPPQSGSEKSQDQNHHQSNTQSNIESDYYALLNLPRDASKAQIKKAYYRSARELHPDKHAEKSPEEQKMYEEQFKQLSNAYDVLYDDSKRATYDFSHPNAGKSFSHSNNVQTEAQTTASNSR